MFLKGIVCRYLLVIISLSSIDCGFYNYKKNRPLIRRMRKKMCNIDETVLSMRFRIHNRSPYSSIVHSLIHTQISQGRMLIKNSYEDILIEPFNHSERLELKYIDNIDFGSQEWSVRFGNHGVNYTVDPEFHCDIVVTKIKHFRVTINTLSKKFEIKQNALDACTGPFTTYRCK